MGRFFARKSQGGTHRTITFDAAVSARLDGLRRYVDADRTRFGDEIMHQYRIERADARLRGDWAGFRRADDKLVYLESITG